MISSLFFVLRLSAAWLAVYIALSLVLAETIFHDSSGAGYVVLAGGVLVAIIITGAFSHVRRVRLIAGDVNPASLSRRQRRQIEIPLEAGEAFDLVDAAIRELPGAHDIEVGARQPAGARPRQALQSVSGRQRAMAEHERAAHAAQPDPGDGHAERRRRQRDADLRAGAAPPGPTGSWSTTAPTWRTPKRSGAPSRAAWPSGAAASRPAARQTATEKELTVAKLSLLHAQVEPHFLYNTLASAQLLTRSDPAARRRDAGQPDHLPAPLAAAHRGCAVDRGRGTRAGARLPRHPEDPHGRAAAPADRRAGAAARGAVPAR